MKINRENYEPYFIDLIDGTLSGLQADELLEFIRENPDLVEELNGLEKTKLPPDRLLKYDHHLLLKSDFDRPEVFEETCIRAIEHELSEEDHYLFENYLSTHLKAKKEFKLYEATISKPDKSLVYPEKNKLKKTKILNPFWYSIAAVLLIGFFIWLSNMNEELPQPLAQQTNIKIENPVIQPKIPIIKSVSQQQIKTIASISKPIIAEKKAAEKNVIRTSDELETLSSIRRIEYKLTGPMLIAELAPVKVEMIPVVQTEKQKNYPTIPEFIAHQVSKINLKPETSKLGKAALNRVSSITNDKLAYATNRKGEVSKIEFNSKLLAFSFPVKQNK